MPKLAYRTTLPRPDDPTILDAIYRDVSDGMPMRYAAQLAGISESTAYHWRMTGEAALADHRQGQDELGSHALFVQTVKEAEAACVRSSITEWRKAEKSWPAWATLLQRRFPEDFGIRDKLEVQSTSISVTIHAELPQSKLDALLVEAGHMAQLRIDQAREGVPLLSEATSTT